MERIHSLMEILKTKMFGKTQSSSWSVVQVRATIPLFNGRYERVRAATAAPV
jgi:hypothetical protein